VTFVGQMLFEIEGLEGISGSEQIKCHGGNIWVYANRGRSRPEVNAVLGGPTKNKALFMR